MSNAVRVQPDLKFVKELQEVGGESLKKCYQCATCSVVCPLSPADDPYPRKEMVWAQWGLKDRLVNDIDIWLCHNCGTCSDLCPRGAKPGDLLAALRNMAYRKLVQPSIIGTWMSSSKFLPILIAIPAAIYLLIWIARAATLGTAFPLFDAAGKVVEKGGMVKYGGLFPGDYTIDPVFSLLFLFVVYCFYQGCTSILKSFKSLPKTFVVGRTKEPSFCECVVETLKSEVAVHSRFKECGHEEEPQNRVKGHLLVFYAFIALMIVTGVIASAHWGGWLLHKMGLDGVLLTILHAFGDTPLSLFNPVKLLANAGAIMLVMGLTILTKRRMSLDSSKQGSSFYDWYLLGVIWTVACTGILSELLRLVNWAGLAYPMYFFHLVAVFMLIGYLPWSKLGHLVYRTVALAYARKIGRIPMK